MLLDQMLSPEQYVKNANVREGTLGSVEYAIKLPGAGAGETVPLPIDAKFPKEAWERLEDAQDLGNPEAVKEAGEKLETAIRMAAKDISTKYIEPPNTTNFAVMYLPTEGLSARGGSSSRACGRTSDQISSYGSRTTTFAALLTSFQMGFRTLAIQKKGGEVWKILAATKLEFEKFGGLMDRVEKNIGTGPKYSPRCRHGTLGLVLSRGD